MNEANMTVKRNVNDAQGKYVKTLAIIPARGGSKGVPRKNIKSLCGKPLLAWTIEAALEAEGISKLIVSTDDREIKEVALEWGAEVPFIRPGELSTDRAKAIPVLQHAVSFLEEQGQTFDAVMMLQPTSPMRVAKDIEASIEMMQADHRCSSVISVTGVGEYHPARMKYLEEGVLIDPPFCEAYENQPRQELRKMYIRSGAIYLVKTSVLMEGNSLKGNRSLGYVMPKERSVNIDTAFDFELTEWLMSKPDWREK